MKERAENSLEKLANELSVGSCIKHVEAGHTKRELLKLVDEYQIDLVIMAKHNDTSVLGYIGSTTQYIIKNAACDVLVTHE